MGYPLFVDAKEDLRNIPDAPPAAYAVHDLRGFHLHTIFPEGRPGEIGWASFPRYVGGGASQVLKMVVSPGRHLIKR